MFSTYQSGTMDISFDFYGYEDVEPSYSFGPSIRDNYVLHFITRGRGKFFYKQEEISLEAGDLFLLKPNELTFYQADAKEPWSYYWIGLSGTKARDYFSYSTLEQKAYLRNNKNRSTEPLLLLAKEIVDFAHSSKSKTQHIHVLGLLHELLFQLSQLDPSEEKTKENPSHELYLEAKRIIETQYSITRLSIRGIAEELNINRSYLTTVFKTYHSLSPKAFLNEVRMKRAKQLLENTNESVKVIAYSVGFDDPLYFSKTFKHRFDLSPTDYRKKQNQQLN